LEELPTLAITSGPNSLGVLNETEAGMIRFVLIAAVAAALVQTAAGRASADIIQYESLDLAVANSDLVIRVQGALGDGNSSPPARRGLPPVDTESGGEPPLRKQSVGSI
jgi:hypothetical protein